MEWRLRGFVFLLGVGLVLVTLASAVKTFILPRSAPDLFTRLVFRSIRFVFQWRLCFARDYLARDRVMALFAPAALLTLLGAWFAAIVSGYTAMFWAIGPADWLVAFRQSGSSFFTLGFAPTDDLPALLLEFTEAGLGLTLAALLIAYLPTMYAAFSRREATVTLLEVRAGNPPSAVELIGHYHRLHGLTSLSEHWRLWEVWFADISESHSSLTALVFFRSPQPDHSWVTAAGAVLDAAALVLSTVDVARDPQAALCLRAGYLALRHIADYFYIDYDPAPKPDEPISISRDEFEDAYCRLAVQGVPLRPDRHQAWRDFAGWRVNYDTVLLALAALTMAPPAPWSSDRAPAYRPVPLWRR